MSEPFDYSKYEAIPTKVDGTEFRSRLEARWALFFTSIGYDFRYEFKAFKHPRHLFQYTPDFWVITEDGLLILEVKPAAYARTEEDLFKWQWMHDTLEENIGTNAKFAVIYGMPYLARQYFSWSRDMSGKFVLWEQSLPDIISADKYRNEYRNAARHVFED